MTLRQILDELDIEINRDGYSFMDKLLDKQIVVQKRLDSYETVEVSYDSNNENIILTVYQ